MNFTYSKVKNDIWEVIKDKTDFVYESASNCDACREHSEWEYDPEGFENEPAECTEHYEHDACRYFYANDSGYSDSSAPACVVGNWFVLEKFSTEDLAVDSWEALEGHGVRNLLKESKIDIDAEAVAFLNNMQTNQDTGLSWGDAFERSVLQTEGKTEGQTNE